MIVATLGAQNGVPSVPIGVYHYGAAYCLTLHENINIIHTYKTFSHLHGKPTIRCGINQRSVILWRPGKWSILLHIPMSVIYRTLLIRRNHTDCHCISFTLSLLRKIDNQFVLKMKSFENFCKLFDEWVPKVCHVIVAYREQNSVPWDFAYGFVSWIVAKWPYIYKNVNKCHKTQYHAYWWVKVVKLWCRTPINATHFCIFQTKVYHVQIIKTRVHHIVLHEHQSNMAD